MQWRWAVLLSTLQFCGAHGGPSAADALEGALGYLSNHEAVYRKDLIELAAIPSISALSSHAPDIQQAAEWLISRLTKAGLQEVKLLDGATHPAVYGSWTGRPGSPTVLIYGHYDVQPVDPLALWDAPPFDVAVRNGMFWGRGVSDDKGGLLAPVQAIEAYLQSPTGVLPLNVKILLEGQEEVGSPGLPALLERHAALLSADLALSADGGQISATQGGLVLGLRGAAAFQVDARTLAGDVHSGSFGGSVQNALHALTDFVAALHAPDRSVAIDGFYDGVRAITPEDEADFMAFPHDGAAELTQLGASEFVGEAGFSTLARRWLRPTLEVVGMGGGFQGEGVKTITVAAASAKFVARLVPHQDPDAVLQACRQHVEKQRLPGTNLTFVPLGFRGFPYDMPRDSPANRAAAKVLEEELGTKPVWFREGGSIPATAYFQQFLGIDTTVFGFGLPDDNIHAPNERYLESQYIRARTAYVKVLHELAAEASDPSPPVASAQADEAAKDEL